MCQQHQQGRVTRDVVSVSTSQSRDGLETHQRLVSILCRQKITTSQSWLFASSILPKFCKPH